MIPNSLRWSEKSSDSALAEKTNDFIQSWRNMVIWVSQVGAVTQLGYPTLRLKRCQGLTGAASNLAMFVCTSCCHLDVGIEHSVTPLSSPTRPRAELLPASCACRAGSRFTCSVRGPSTAVLGTGTNPHHPEGSCENLHSRFGLTGGGHGG